MAVGIENARLHTRTTRQARTLLLLNEIAQELTSILNLDELLKRIAELLSRLIDYQMFSILLVDATGEKLQHRFSQRFQERLHLKHDISIGKGLVGHAAQAKDAILAPGCQQGPAIHSAESGDALGTGSPAHLPGNRHRRSRPGAHAARILHRRPQADADDAGRADRHRDRKRAALRADCEAGKAAGTGPGTGARIAGPVAAAVASQAVKSGGAAPNLFRPEPSAAICTTSCPTPCRAWGS